MIEGVKLVAVDLDGTLVDSAPDLAFCVDRALEAVGLEPVGETLTRDWIGDGIETLLQRALTHAAGRAPDAAMSRNALEAFDRCYEDNLFVRSTLYPGVLETLDTLRSRGLFLCCVTNKREGFARSLLREAALDRRFELVLGGDTLPKKKPHGLQLTEAARRAGVAIEGCVLVGDSEHDYAATVDAGCGFIWATYGYRRHIEGLPARTARLERFSDLEPLLAEEPAERSARDIDAKML